AADRLDEVALRPRARARRSRALRAGAARARMGAEAHRDPARPPRRVVRARERHRLAARPAGAERDVGGARADETGRHPLAPEPRAVRRLAPARDDAGAPEPKSA